MDKEKYIFIALFLLIISGALFWGWFSSTKEAEVFNRLTGRSDVTWQDALFVELRVDCTK